MTDLFQNPDAQSDDAHRPLPDRLRPQNLDDIIGQDHLTGAGMPLRGMATSGQISSLILWGPPGCGKTTIARILCKDTPHHFEQISAIFSGVADLRKCFDSAKLRKQNGVQTVLFVDEIHRFNKSQQDAFLPVMEDGTIILIGATTENPSFELNAALLSRAQVFVLKRLDENALGQLLTRAEDITGQSLPLTDGARALLITMADGDGRYVLAMAERIYTLYCHHDEGRDLAGLGQSKNIQDPVLQRDDMSEQDLLTLLQRRAPLYDKGDEAHYNLISALHKSVRGSDPDAVLYYFARMLDGGEDPEYLARRMVRMAVEDIGLADPQALVQCNAAWDAYLRLGSPEGELALAQALVYMTAAPKSNAVYAAYKAARDTAKTHGSLLPPKHILNAVTNLMKDQNYGDGYIYDHDTPEGFSGQNYFPDDMPRMNFYAPPERGFEREINKRLKYWAKLRAGKK